MSLLLLLVTAVAASVKSKLYMKAKHLIFILVILFTSIMPFSCNKGNLSYTFKGKMTESIGQSPLKDVEIKLYQKVINNGAASSTYTFAGTDMSDNSGNYEIIIDRQKVTAFKIEFEKENYFPLSLEVSSADISTENANQFDQELDAMTWINFQLKNNFPLETDHFKLIKQTFREDCEGCTVNSVMDFYGPLDTSFTYPTTAGEYVKFIYVNVTNGTSTFDSIYTTPFETIIYPIIY